MNLTVYIFGKLSTNYTQLPDDSTSRAVFQQMYSKMGAVTQLAVHRDGDLMYYAYLRRLGKDPFIGLCVLVNGVMVTDVAALFQAFENVISEMVIKGWLIKFDGKGSTVPKTTELYLGKEDFASVEALLRREFESLSSRGLLPVDYSLGIDSEGNFSHDGNPSDILKSSYSNAYTYVYKSKGYNTSLVSSYKAVLARVNNEKEKLSRENKSLKEELAGVKRQKKQFSLVLLLVLVIIGLGAGLYLLFDELGWKNYTIEETEKENSSLSFTIDEQKSQISNLNKKISSRDKTIADLKDTLAARNALIKRFDSTLTVANANIRELMSALSSEKEKKKEDRHVE